MNLKLIDLKENDFILVKEIYDFYILNSTATFHTDLMPIEELKSVILTSPLPHETTFDEVNPFVW